MPLALRFASIFRLGLSVGALVGAVFAACAPLYRTDSGWGTAGAVVLVLVVLELVGLYGGRWVGRMEATRG